MTSTNQARVPVGLLAETHSRETRVALTPDDVRKLRKLFDVTVERGAGAHAGFSDRAYEDAGAVVAERSHVFATASVFVMVRALADVSSVPRGVTVISLGGRDPEISARMYAGELHHLGLERVPRISRAQSMDVLTSQATIAGYAAVLEGARYLRVILPMMATAGGNIRPAKMIALGAGVAGLQAIATARRLGAVVHGFDVREVAREQVESLGAKFVFPVVARTDADAAGGYAREQSTDQQEHLRRALAEHLAPMQLIITSAQVPGRQAPILMDEATVAGLADGTVIVDLAAETGGNCSLTRADEVVREHGVTILGPTNLAGSIAADASRLFGGNVRAILEHIVTKDGALKLDANDPITSALLGATPSRPTSTAA